MSELVLQRQTLQVNESSFSFPGFWRLMGVTWSLTASDVTDRAGWVRILTGNNEIAMETATAVIVAPTMGQVLRFSLGTGVEQAKVQTSTVDAFSYGPISSDAWVNNGERVEVGWYGSGTAGDLLTPYTLTIGVRP